MAQFFAFVSSTIYNMMQVVPFHGINSIGLPNLTSLGPRPSLYWSGIETTVLLEIVQQPLLHTSAYVRLKQDLLSLFSRIWYSSQSAKLTFSGKINWQSQL